ncbi:MAG: alkaline phosphatase family protein [Gallionella sp.]
MKHEQTSMQLNAKRIVAYVTLACFGFSSLGIPTLAAAEQMNDRSAQNRTATPIKHVIVIIGENRTFDHVFGTYRPPRGQTISNLLSKGIVNADGSPGPNFALATQYQATLTAPAKFTLSPNAKTPYQVLPAPLAGSANTVASDTNPPPLATLALATLAEGGVLLPEDIPLLTTGATGLPQYSIDTRIANVNSLPSGPFPLTPSLSYDDYAASPVHRFYQGWQQADCSVAHATRTNPSGCLADLYPWVETSIGAGSNGAAQPAGFNDLSTGEGSTAMGFYNVGKGDAPYLTELARDYAISDNYHQAVQGGTGANHIMLGTADAMYYSDGQGHMATPPADEIENPNPQPGTNNYYTQDGYSGGSYSECADASQPGVGAILGYLNSLPNHPKPNCAPGAYYLLNNYNPGYNGDGSVNTSAFTIPPSSVPSIADSLIAKNIPWKYYGEGWNSFVANSPESVYCNICNPFLYETSIMSNPALVSEHLKDTTDLYADIANGKLPAVSFVKPGWLLDGHPASSKLDLFEGFVRKLVQAVQSDPKLWASTAIMVTFDEGGGYYDSGYIQPVDFFGDGSRIPMIVVSPYSRGGHVDHTYTDHVSIVKFIERNWGLSPISNRSRDNLPDPRQLADNPYVPVNSPAIGDLFQMFDFDQPDFKNVRMNPFGH